MIFYLELLNRGYKVSVGKISKIIKNSSFNKVDEKLFSNNSEKSLYDVILKHKETSEDLDKYIASLNVFINPVVEFFDNVLVMDKDEKIKNNRIALLNLLNDKFRAVCDFEKL